MRNIKIIIAAYNAEKNIARLLQAVVLQEIDKDINLKIVVYSDTSSDNTVLEAKKVKSKNILVVDGKKRLGFAGVVKQAIKNNKSDLLMLLNDDITIRDRQFISKIISYSRKNNFGLAGVNIKPLSPSNFIQKAINSSFNAYRNMAKKYKNGNNKFTNDGKVLILSREFCNKIKFPADISYMACVDSFLYFSCNSLKMKYRFLKDTVVYFKFPSTIDDYLKWTSRNNSNKEVLRKMFGELVDIHYKKPISIYFYMAVEFIKNPFGSVFVWTLRPLIKFRAQKIAKNFNPFWETITTTKI